MEKNPNPQPPTSPVLLGIYGQFLRSPNLTTTPESLPVRQIKNQVLRLYSLHLLVMIAIAIVIGQVINPQDNFLLEFFAGTSPWFWFTIAVIAAPLIEESIFRLPLRGSVFNLTLSMSLVVLLGIIGFSPFNRALVIGIGGMLAGLNIYLWFAQPKFPVRLQAAYTRYPRLIFYGLALLFGAIHITNYQPQMLPLLPLLVLPQVVVGLWLGFIRLRYGFGWAVLAHAFHNGLLLLPILLITGLGSAQLQAQGLDNIDPETLPFSDSLLILGIGFSFLGGLIFCGIHAWGVVREWQRNRAC
ncbi:MAG: CPBP family intramembrane metalloprotease [Symploca sp. SIO2C1]|nr:CPBP family intramembrane metalloprotease [Symploca sp. SIO2C1]